MNKLIHSVLLIVVFVIIAYLVVIGVSDIRSIIDAITQLGWETWFAILTLSLLNYGIRYWRWYIYLKPVLPSTLSHWRHLSIYMAGFALTMTPGKAGEMTRCLYLKNYAVPSQRTTGAFFVERIMDLFVILLMATFVVSIFSVEKSILAITVSIILIVIAIAIIHLPKEKVLNNKWVRSLPKKILALIDFIESSLDSARNLLTIKHIITAICLGGIAWGLEGVGLFLVMQSFSIEHSDIFIAIGIYGFAMLLGALSFLPGGVGGAEAAMVFMLMKTGFDAPQAIAITVICRIATLWFAVALGAIFTLGLSISGLSPAEKKV